MASKLSAAQRALEVARAAASGGNWTDVSNAVFGLGGITTTLFPDQSARTAFSKSAEYGAIMQLIESMQGDPDALASGKLSVRIPRSLHVALQREADAEDVSLNQLIVAKLSSQLRAIV